MAIVRLTRFFASSVVVVLLSLAIEQFAAAADSISSPSAADMAGGLVLSVMSSTQLNFGRLSIGAGYIGDGPYLDEKGVRRNGIHANLSIAVQGEPAQFRQPDVREGQTLEVARYRISILNIEPGPRGTVVLRLWAPP